jgi:hypothetical protein
LPAATVRALLRARTEKLRALHGELEREAAALEAALCGGGGAEVEAGGLFSPGGGGGGGGGGGAEAGDAGAAPGSDLALGRTLGVSPLLAKQSQLYLCFRAAAARLTGRAEALRCAIGGDEGAACAAEDAASVARCGRAPRAHGATPPAPHAAAARKLALLSPAPLNAAARRLREGRAEAWRAASAAAARAACTAEVLSRALAAREAEAEHARAALLRLSFALETADADICALEGEVTRGRLDVASLSSRLAAFRSAHAGEAASLGASAQRVRADILFEMGGGGVALVHEASAVRVGVAPGAGGAAAAANVFAAREAALKAAVDKGRAEAAAAGAPALEAARAASAAAVAAATEEIAALFTSRSHVRTSERVARWADPAEAFEGPLSEGAGAGLRVAALARAVAAEECALAEEEAARREAEAERNAAMAVLEAEAATLRDARSSSSGGGGGGGGSAPPAELIEQLIALSEETGEDAWGLWCAVGGAACAALPAPERSGQEALPWLGPCFEGDALARACAAAARDAARVDDAATTPAHAGAALALQVDLARLMEGEAGRCRAAMLQRPPPLSLLSALGAPSPTAGVSLGAAQRRERLASRGSGGSLLRGGGESGGGAAGEPSRFGLEARAASPRSPTRGTTLSAYAAALQGAQADAPYSTRRSLTQISEAMAAGAPAPPAGPAAFFPGAAAPAPAPAAGPRSPFSRVNWQLVVDAAVAGSPQKRAPTPAAFASPAADAYILRAPPPAASPFVR